jgi:type I restriction enzyme S subunit
MAGRHQVYPSYGESGVEWLGKLPAHWETKRLGHFFEERRQKVSDKDYSALSVTKQGIVPQLENAAKTDAGDNRKLVLKNDFVINSRSDRKGSSGVSIFDGSVSLISIVMIPRNITPRFVHHLLRSYPFQEEFYRYGKGIVADLWSTNSSEMKNILLPDIPIQEQQKIANFLDHETDKIDILIEKQQQLIKLLKEKRQAVISHAVTKGLNPNVPMRDSGVEWLGEVPVHWDISKVKFEYKNLDGRRIPLSTEQRSYKQGDYPYYGASGVIDHVDGYLFDDDLVLVSEDGANLLMRSYAIAFPAYGRYWVNNHAHILKPKDSNTEFWAEVIEVRDLTPYISGSAQPKFTSEALSNLVIAVPAAEDEVKSVASYVRRQKEKYLLLIVKAEDSIKLMHERRAALISAAVTGKIDVRKWKQPNV